MKIGTTVKIKPAEAVKEEWHGKVGHITRIVVPFFFEVTFKGVYVDETGVFSGDELEDVWEEK